MSATKVMLAAIGLGVIGRWANNKKALPSAGGVLEIIGALFLISLLDKGKTQPVAQGFAWLFFVAIMLSDSSPITGLAKAEGFVSTPAAHPLPVSEQGPVGSVPDSQNQFRWLFPNQTKKG